MFDDALLESQRKVSWMRRRNARSGGGAIDPQP